MSTENKTDPGSGSDTQALETALIALQKTLSRVSRDTAPIHTKNRDDACAIMVGPVQFHLSVATRLNTAEQRLLLDRSGPITLELTGTIQTDVRSALQSRQDDPLPEQDERITEG